MHAFLSIIVPVYNAARFLPRCLESLIGQTYTNLEIICVDDGSTDDSGRILDEYAARDARLKVIHQENAGVSAARNRGLETAMGDIIGFCDADDTYAPNALQLVTDLFITSVCHIVVAGIEHVNEQEGSRWKTAYESPHMCTARELQQLMMHDERIMGSVGNKFFKREILQDRLFSTRLTHCEDMMFVSEVLSMRPDIKITISPHITYQYHANADSATTNPARLLDSRGRLRYLAAMDAIKELYPYDWQMWLLVRSNQFRLVLEAMEKFQNNDAILRQLARQGIRYAVAYLLCRRREPLRKRIKAVIQVATGLVS